jgi:hypothetical protein
MEQSFSEKVGIRGHLTIHKIVDNSEELVFDDNNIIVSGFGWGLSHLFSKVGSLRIDDYQLDRFQLGVSGHSGNQVSSTFQLSGPLSSTSEYAGGGDSNLLAFSGSQIKNNAVVTIPNPIFAKIPFSKVTRIDERSVRYTIFIDEDSCNDLTRSGSAANLNEIGLFMKNPLGYSDPASILVAYKYFSNIRKTSDFGLIFRWTITFS